MSEFDDRVAEALRAIGWGAARINLGPFTVWHLVTETPAFRFDTLIRVFPVSERLAVLRARSSFNPELAAYLFSVVSEDWLVQCPRERISIDLQFNLGKRRYDRIGVAPPLVANCFASQSKFLSDHSYWVFPTIRGDFRGDEDSAAFHFRLGKGGRIAVIDWSRDSGRADDREI